MRHVLHEPRGARATRIPVLKFARVLQAGLVAVACASLLWIVIAYENALRDARYLDGWMLAAGMSGQLMFQFARRLSLLSLKSAARWRSVHIGLGYVLIAVFASHSEFSLPDTAFEWALWLGFVLVTLTGVFGTYLTWAQRSASRFDAGVGYERISDLRSDLALKVRSLIGGSEPERPGLGLPQLPHDAWIVAFYSRHLREYFEDRRDFVAHLIGSRRTSAKLIDEIDDLARYVDVTAQGKLASIKTLVIEKDRLDYTSVYLGLTRAWLMIHVPSTYALIVLTVLHVVVVYAFSSGAR